MASLGFQLSFFLLLVLVLSPQIQAREGKVFSLFTHLRFTHNVKDHQDLPEKPKAGTAPTPAPITAPTTAPTPAPITAPTPAPTTESIIQSGPAPEPDFVDMGNGYGLYGTESSSYQYSPNKETPTTTTFENKLLSEEFTSNTNLYNNYNANNYNNEVDRNNNNNYNNEEYRSNYNNGYHKNYVDNSYSNNNHNERHSNNNYNDNEYNNYNNNYNGNSYEVKREGMSDTRFMENGRYYYAPLKTNNENYNLNEYESVRGSAENEGYYDKTRYPNEFDTMEEYEKQQASQGYTP